MALGGTLSRMSQRAGIYCRISSDKTGEEVGVTSQEDDGRGLCDARGWAVAEVYRDNDLTATTGNPRPQYDAMVAAIRRGELDVVVVYHLSRLWRNRRERADGIEIFKDHRTAIMSVKGPDLDLSSAYGRGMTGLLGEFDTLESEIKSERIQRRMRANAEAGKPAGGGTRPFGYAQDKTTVLPDEAALIREAARRVLAGEAVIAIAKEWNRRGIRTAGGGLWSQLKLKRVLVSARIAGMREHQPRPHGRKREFTGEITGPAAWPAVIAETDSARLRRMLTDPSRRVTPGPNERYLLAGLVYCSRCEHRMVGRPREDGRARYVCDNTPGRASCGKVYMLADHLESYIVAMTVEALASPEYRQALAAADGGPDADTVMERIREQEQELADLAADFGAQRISRREWLAAREPIEARLASTRAQLDRSDTARALENVPEDREGLEGFFTDVTPMSTRRAVMRAVFLWVTVHPGVRGRNFFDPDRVKERWRV